MEEEQKVIVWRYNMMYTGFVSLMCCIDWVKRKVAWEVHSTRSTRRYESFVDAADALEFEREWIEKKKEGDKA